MEKLMPKNKHDHTLTDILKVLIFALFLLLPFFCFIPTGLYYGFNEHAVNETTTEVTYKYQSNEVNSLDDLVLNNIYHYEEFSFSYDMIAQDNYFNINVVKCGSQSILNTSYDIDEYFVDDYINNIDNFITYNFQEYLYVYYSNNAAYAAVEIEGYQLTLYEIDFYFNDDISLNNFKSYLEYFTQELTLPTYTDYNVIESVDTNVQDTISNKMYQAWEGVWKTPLFNWTSNTPFNASLNGFITIFGITANSYIGNALIWLLTVTAIYIVIDIVIGVFKWLTHLIGNK